MLARSGWKTHAVPPYRWAVLRVIGLRLISLIGGSAHLAEDAGHAKSQVGGIPCWSYGLGHQGGRLSEASELQGLPVTPSGVPGIRRMGKLTILLLGTSEQDLTATVRVAMYQARKDLRLIGERAEPVIG